MVDEVTFKNWQLFLGAAGEQVTLITSLGTAMLAFVGVIILQIYGIKAAEDPRSFRKGWLLHLVLVLSAIVIAAGYIARTIITGHHYDTSVRETPLTFEEIGTAGFALTLASSLQLITAMAAVLALVIWILINRKI